MKAFVIDRYGSIDHLHLAEMPEPVAGPGEVVVRIAAASANPLDLKIASGGLKPILPYKLPVAMGSDFAGTVEAVGKGVTSFAIGDRVYACADPLHIGAYAERIVVRADLLALAPSNLTLAEAASLPLVAMTALQAFTERFKLGPQHKVLIHAGAGGVGSHAIQLARHLGAFVATTTSTANIERVRGLGADLVIDYKTTDFSTALSGYDLVLDTLGGESLEKSIGVLKPGGRIVSVNGPPDAGLARQQGLNPLLGLVFGFLSRKVRIAAKRAGVTYDYLFMRPNGAHLAEVTRLVEAGAIRPIIDRTYPFAATKDALAYLATGRAKGKIVVTQ